MKRASVVVAAVLLAGAVAPLIAQQRPSQILQKILVKVNGEVFTLTELEDRQIEAMRQRVPQLQAVSEIQDEALRAQLAEITPEILMRAVDELLLLQRGRELGFRMTEEQFKKVVEQVKTDNQLNDQQLEVALKQEGMTMAAWRQVMERQVIIQNVTRQEVMGQTTLTDAELRLYYQAHPDEFLKPATVTLREIFVAVPTETQGGQAVVNVAAAEAAKAKIDAARERVLKGEDFAAVVAEVSESGSKAEGGIIGPVGLGDIDPVLARVFQALKVGDVSEPVRSPRGYQIFKLESRSEAAPEPFEAVRERVYQQIMNERVDSETAKYLDRMRAGALIEWKDETYHKLYEQARAKAGGGRP